MTSSITDRTRIADSGISTSRIGPSSWERIYAAQRHLSVWPWTDVVSLTNRFVSLCPGARVLELGCGAGANIPFFETLDIEYWGIDASPTIVKRLQEVYPHLADRIIVGNFAEEIAAPGTFDLILDRGSITHNSTSQIREIVATVLTKLSGDGTLLGVDWFSTEFMEFESGQAGEDSFTRINFTDGRLSGTGIAHFCDEEHLRDLLACFDIRYLEHKAIQQYVPQEGGRFASWNFVASAL